MKRYRWLLGCCLFLSIGMLWAADEPDLRMLQQKAAQSRDMEGYVGVCKYLYQTEENPELLLLYADSIHQLATKSNNTPYHNKTGLLQISIPLFQPEQ